MESRKSTATKFSRPSVAPFSRYSLDPKQFSDKAFQTQCQREIISFFQENCPDIPISIKYLQTPNTKDYILIFTTLMRKVDPLYELSGKIEDEIPAIFKAMGYPFTISKNSLLAVGAPNSWPTLLASLSWLVDSIKIGHSIKKSKDSEKEASYHIAQKAYQMFLSTSDFSVELNEMIDLLLRKHEENKEQITIIGDNIEALSCEKKKLVKIKSNFDNSDSMISKLKSFIFSNKSIISAGMSQISQLERELTDLAQRKEALFRSLEEQKNRNLELKKSVEHQPYSVDDILKMKDEIKALEKAIKENEEVFKITKENRVNNEKILNSYDNEIFSLYKKTHELGTKVSSFGEPLRDILNKDMHRDKVLNEEFLLKVFIPRVSENQVRSLEEIMNRTTEMQNSISSANFQNSQLAIQLQNLDYENSLVKRRLDELVDKSNKNKEFTSREIERSNEDLRKIEEELRLETEKHEKYKLNIMIVNKEIENAQREYMKLKEQAEREEEEANAENEQLHNEFLKVIRDVEDFKSRMKKFVHLQYQSVDAMYNEYFAK